MAVGAAAVSMSLAASRFVPHCQVKASQPVQDSTPILSLQSQCWTRMPHLSFSSFSSSWQAALIESNDHRSSSARTTAVVARFNDIITKQLLEGALATFKAYSVAEEDVAVVWLPGSFEIGLVVKKLGKSGRYNAIPCIGAVIMGDTTYYDAVANSTASGVLSTGLNTGVPCIFGVLTCDNMEQAGGKSGNKRAEATLTAIEMASLFEHHLKW